MRILVIGWEFPPSKTGGLGTHCYELVKNLGKRGVKVLLLVPQRSKGAIKNLENVEVIEVGSKISCPYNAVNPNKIDPRIFEKGYGWNLFEEVRLFNKKCVSIALTKQFDAIHCHDWMTVPAGVELKARTGKPLVLTIHSTEYDRTTSIYPMKYITDIEKWGIQEADLVITVSYSMRKQLIERYEADERKVQVIYNGIDCSRYYGLTKKEGKLVLFLGRLTNQKGPYFFLHTVKKVLEQEKDVLFIVVGQGEKLPELINQAFGLEIMDHVIFTGFISEQEVLEAYARASVYVMPSVAEPFGITALEAMASGTPVIVSKNAGVSETVSHCFKVDYWDTHEMANKIISILKYPPLQECMRKNSYRELEGLGWGRVAEQTMDVYRRAL
jgi:glycogen(starch) synthase